MSKRYFLLLALGVAFGSNNVCSFHIGPSIRSLDSSSLPAVRQPRRNLKKRKGRERKSPANQYSGLPEDPNDVWETKPLIGSRRKEAGLDFWVDPEDLEKEKQRQLAIANRKAVEGEMSKEKLISEVVAPYKQNWIGIISVLFIVLATIIANFPELLENPSISFPDLDAGGDPIPLQSTLKSAAKEVAEILSE